MFWRRTTVDRNLANFIYPRLKSYRKLDPEHVRGIKQKNWHIIIDDMIYAFEHIAKGHLEPGSKYILDWKSGDIDWRRIEVGLNFFSKFFLDLRWH